MKINNHPIYQANLISFKQKSEHASIGNKIIQNIPVINKYNITMPIALSALGLFALGAFLGHSVSKTSEIVPYPDSVDDSSSYIDSEADVNSVKINAEISSEELAADRQKTADSLQFIKAEIDAKAQADSIAKVKSDSIITAQIKADSIESVKSDSILSAKIQARSDSLKNEVNKAYEEWERQQLEFRKAQQEIQKKELERSQAEIQMYLDALRQ